jgi:hypothetical protein
MLGPRTRVPGSAGERPANHARILHRRRDEKFADLLFFISLLTLVSGGILVDSCLAESTRRVAKRLDLRRVSAKSARTVGWVLGGVLCAR